MFQCVWYKDYSWSELCLPLWLWHLLTYGHLLALFLSAGFDINVGSLRLLCYLLGTLVFSSLISILPLGLSSGVTSDNSFPVPTGHLRCTSNVPYCVLGSPILIQTDSMTSIHLLLFKSFHLYHDSLRAQFYLLYPEDSYYYAQCLPLDRDSIHNSLRSK